VRYSAAQSRRAYYADTLAHFVDTSPEAILGILADASSFAIEMGQRDAWREQIVLLRKVLTPYRDRGKLYFEYSIPRLGKRIDVVLVIDHVVFVVEFKMGETQFAAAAIDQVFDYALDLKNFHESSYSLPIVPILIPTKAEKSQPHLCATPHGDQVYFPVLANTHVLGAVIESALDLCHGTPIDVIAWERGRYRPTPTIVEAATALYSGHAVADISRNDASATNLSITSDAIAQVISSSRALRQKSICFVTGVPGAGKTLVGLDIATKHMSKNGELYSVFLSGNGPLVAILREALARDKVRREAAVGRRLRKGVAMSEVKAFIQNVHHFRDECLLDTDRAPIEHVALFDEAQRAWNLEQTSAFMLRKKQRPNFAQSEPEFLISCLDRHPDWAVIVCLVGGGQEINTGEAGITEWVEAITRSFPHWHVYLSSRLHDVEYGAGRALALLQDRSHIHLNDQLHLNVSMRSFRAEHVSALVKQILDCDADGARITHDLVRDRYPIVVTRDIGRAKKWLRENARGSERYGLVVSSQAQRLKPHAIDVRCPMDPIHWFLDGKEDVRSSYYLEDVATEFHVQGLELDWACVVWDADFRFKPPGCWDHWSFVGSRWNQIRKDERRTYLKNAYRVLLTRARQGMVIVVPPGDPADPTRIPRYYDETYDYLLDLGLPHLDSDDS
jgi:hypothetical protein